MDVNKMTAMQQLLNQLRDERNALPMDIEWNRCFQAIESVIESKYITMEKEQIIEAFKHGELPPLFVNFNAEQYYNETYNK
jgi:hypothetical protein